MPPGKIGMGFGDDKQQLGGGGFLTQNQQSGLQIKDL
jgi:hypothetical protein